jgi:hypothetical protein
MFTSGYSQIWLNLPLNDHHYGYITKFRINSRMDATFAQRTTEPFYVLAFCSFFGLALLFSNYVNFLLLGGCVRFYRITNK